MDPTRGKQTIDTFFLCDAKKFFFGCPPCAHPSPFFLPYSRANERNKNNWHWELMKKGTRYMLVATTCPFYFPFLQWRGDVYNYSTFPRGGEGKEKNNNKVDYHTHPSMPMRILFSFFFTLTVSSRVERPAPPTP